MSETEMSWDHGVAAVWAAMDSYEPEAFVEKIERLTAELPSGDALGLFERASAHDSTGHSDVAVPLYRAALQAGLTGIRRREATISWQVHFATWANPPIQPFCFPRSFTHRRMSSMAPCVRFSRWRSSISVVSARP